MRQIYHPYHLWEDYKNGMWQKEPSDKTDEFLLQAIDFTGDHILYGYWMIQVIKKWKYSCEHNLTNLNMNRKAWVGHAAVCMALGIPEHITRSAWWKLTEEQRVKANEQAKIAIKKWEQNAENTFRN